MNNDNFAIHVDETFDACEQLLKIKGGEYTEMTDRLANFKRVSDALGLTYLQVASIYASKHFDSIMSFVKKDAIGVAQFLSEPIEGRFYDLINYCVLMLAIIKEEQGIIKNDVYTSERDIQQDESEGVIEREIQAGEQTLDGKAGLSQSFVRKYCCGNKGRINNDRNISQSSSNKTLLNTPRDSKAWDFS